MRRLALAAGLLLVGCTAALPPPDLVIEPERGRLVLPIPLVRVTPADCREGAPMLLLAAFDDDTEECP